MPQDTQLPKHLGLILDGNRRWARARGMPVVEGHRQGYEVLRNILDSCLERGIPYVSAFVFSTENWSRTSVEVKFLMNLVLTMVTRDLEEFDAKGVRIVWLGSKDGVGAKVRKAIEHAETVTAGNTQATFGLGFNHGGHREIAEAVQRLVRSGMSADDIDEAAIAGQLDYPDVPPIDLLIRTSGEQRLSNFMLWRAAYAELAFTDTYWPDFTNEELGKILDEYAQRGRRFGK